MKTIQNKLSSQSGASMLLALVFLLFCLFVGGSVLSAASANGSRAARQKENQQAYLSQRSASLLLADMLRGSDDAAMQLTVKEIFSGDSRVITFMAHGDGPQSELQLMLYEKEIFDYLQPLIQDSVEYGLRFVNFEDSYSPPATIQEKGKISVKLTEGTNEIDSLIGKYDMTYELAEPDKDKFIIDYAVTPEGGEAQTSYVRITMKRYPSRPYEVTVNGVTTKTTIIRWDDPVIEKGGE